VVVDDHLMEITHILRGEEWINSVPKHKLLYRYFDWEMPVHCHLPLLRNPDQSKLSKRKNPTSINYYRRIGMLPEALVNYLGMMGWSMPDEREIFSPAEMADDFDAREDPPGRAGVRSREAVVAERPVSALSG
jgi:glutamyl-tRNA synthetase